VNSSDLLVEIDIGLEFVESVLLGSGMSIPNDLFPLLALLPLFLFLAFSPLLVYFASKNVHTATCQIFEGRDHVGTALKFG
jgi:hypothetical protein